MLRVRTWSWVALEDGALDKSWQLVLAWRAARGEWVGWDFHYTMGPLYQLLTRLGALGGDTATAPGEVFAGMEVGFRLACLVVALAVVLRRVPSPLGRALAFAALAVLGNGAGLATIRGFASLFVIVEYAASVDDDDAPVARSALVPAIGLAVGLLLSFDRFALGVVSVVAIAAYELAWRARRRSPLRPALARLGRFALALSAVLAVLALAGALSGADPIEYVRAQRTLTSAYAANLSTVWSVGVPASNFVALVAAGLAFAAWRLAAREGSPLAGALAAGALPAAAFGAVLSDPGHLFLAFLPLAGAFVLIAAGVGQTRPGPSTRAVAGVLAAAFLLGWAGVHPKGLTLRPATLAQAVEAWGGGAAQQEYVTERRVATEWLRARAAREPLECAAVSASISVAHPLAGVPGPTQMALRWNDRLQRELAAELERARCPYFVYHLYTFDVPRGSWFLGEDFLALSERYELFETLGPSLVALRRREERRPIESRPIALASPEPRALPVPGEILLPLGREVPGTSVVRLEYELSMNRLRALLGGSPFLEWRFERGGRPLGEWQWVHHMKVGEPAVVYFAPDPEAVEQRWIREVPALRGRRADALRIRARARGPSTAREVRLAVLGLSELLAPDAREEPARACEPEVALERRVASGGAFVRAAAPEVVGDAFTLFPNAPLTPHAEVYVPIVPCEGACLTADLRVHGEAGDGADVEVHVIDGLARPLVADAEVPAGDVLRRVQARLDRFAGRPVLLRVGATPRESEVADHLYVHRARVAPCSTPVDLADALRAGRARSFGGRASARGDAIALAGLGDTEVSYEAMIDQDLCVSYRVELDTPESAATYRFDVRVDGLRHRLDEGRLDAGNPSHELAGHSLHDWHGRWVEIVLGATRASDAPAAVRWARPRVHLCGEP